MRNAVVTAVLAGSAAIALAAAHGQVQSVPGPGSGVVAVTGNVSISDGLVRATQSGDWRVAIANAPDVRVVNTPAVSRVPLAFLKPGGRVIVTWPEGASETIRIAQLGGGGWILGDSGGRTRWINLESARYVESTQ